MSADPIEFSQNVARILQQGLLDDLLIQDVPKQIEDIRLEFEYLMDQALRQKDITAAEDVWQEYVSFVTYAESDAREYGIVLSAVMEQLRVGLGHVVDLRNRGLTYGDAQSKNDLQRLRRKHGLPRAGVRQETDFAKIKDDAAAEEAA